MKRDIPNSALPTRFSRARWPLAGSLRGACERRRLMLYEVGTEDVGLASAGYTARAQDASTVFTNPAGMTRLDGTQSTLGRPGALRRPGIHHRAGDVARTGRRQMAAIRSAGSRRRRVLFVQRVARPQARLRRDRQLRPGAEVRRRLGRPVLRPGRNAGRRVAPAVGRVSRQHGALAGREPQRDVRQAAATRSRSTTSSAPTAVSS